MVCVNLQAKNPENDQNANSLMGSFPDVVNNTLYKICK